MSIQVLCSRLREITLKVPAYSHLDVCYYEDEHKIDHKYILMCSSSFTMAMGKYLNAKGRVGANFLLDPLVKGSDLELLLTVNGVGDVVFHWIGHSKLQLPNIAVSSSIKYSMKEIEDAITAFIATPLLHPGSGNAGTFTGNGASNPPPGFIRAPTVVPPQEEIKIRTLPRTGESFCDCGGRKAGYKDREKHGHAQWCRVQGMIFSHYGEDGTGD